MKRVWSIIIIISIILIPIVYADGYPDDIYDGDYSLQEMLENYNVITFGKKELDSHMTQNDFIKGDTRIFHINSRFLINGNLNVSRIDLLTNSDNLKSYIKSITNIYNRSIFFCGANAKNSDMEGSLNCGINSYITDNLPNKLFVDSNHYFYINGTGNSNSASIGNYINFDRLYNSITDSQSKIKRGEKVIPSNKKVNIKIGGNYYIDNINEVDDIIFDNFSDNNNKLTIITINNEDNIKFPKIWESADNNENRLIPTNDFIGMARPNGEYANYYVLDKYYGNIIWNIPNATYIELPSAPFVGHLIAPNADLYGPELHYAGAFLVNSLYLEGSSEAHFYPLQKNIPYKNTNLKAINKVDTKKGSLSFENGINNELLEEEQEVIVNVKAKGDYIFSSLKIEDEEGNLIDYESTGVEGQYKFIMPSSNVTITPIYDLEYKFIEGMDQIFNVNTHSNMKFRINMPYSEFKETGKVFIDDEEIDCNCYELSEGSTIITFKDTCTKKIKNGKHVIKTTMEDGSVCNTNFNIEQTTNIIDTDNSKNIKNPITSDRIIITIILSVLAIVTIVYIRKKDKIKIS